MNFDNIYLKELEGKEEIVKSIRFSKEEFYMLKCCKANNKKFATFIKELINDYIKNENTILDNTTNIDINKIKAEIKKELKEELKEELLKELKKEGPGEEGPGEEGPGEEGPGEEKIKEEVKVNDPKNEETKKALFNLIGRK